ncbi:hypothetical protein [Kitasatospora sp. NPDC056531]
MASRSSPIRSFAWEMSKVYGRTLNADSFDHQRIQHDQGDQRDAHCC